MAEILEYKVLLPHLQVGFLYKLRSIKDVYFHKALSLTVKTLRISDIDEELKKYVSVNALQKLAVFSLRGEAVFPLPILLNENPFLLGYYRLLLGFSQKEFFSKGPFGAFKAMEEKGKLTNSASPKIEELCKSLIQSAEILIQQIDNLNLTTLSEMQLLTVGPQLRGSMNNQYGQIASQKTFGIIKDFVKDYIVISTPNSVKIKNDSERLVTIQFASDPDIEIIENLSKGTRGLVSIEIKGGKDFSNIHNRIGEAEKSHQKAKQRGYFEFMTIISVDIGYTLLKQESPTTSHFFHLEKIADISSDEYYRFKDILSSILGITI